MIGAECETSMRARLTYGRGPRLIAALFLAILIVGTVLAITRPGAGRSSPGSARTVSSEFAGIPQNGTMLGDPRAPATLVEFADLQCPFCAQYALGALPGVIRDWVRPGKLRLDLRLVSIIGPDSGKAARLAGAAALQDRLWQLAELFYLNQGTENSGYVTSAFLRAIATATPGLDVERALAARNSAAVTSQLERAPRSAGRLGVSSTPSFFLVRPGKAPVQLHPSALTTNAISSAIEGAWH
jgi:protein-disulfide isomerase